MISIDPGNFDGGACWGRWLNRDLDSCGEWPCTAYDDGEIAVIETQVIIPKFTKRPKDIITLAHLAGAIARDFGWPADNRVKWVEPRSWKGNTKKPKTAAAWASYAIHRLVVMALSPRELAIYTVALERFPPGERHNLADAVGIGLHELGRLPTARTERPLMTALKETLRRQAS